MKLQRFLLIFVSGMVAVAALLLIFEATTLILSIVIGYVLISFIHGLDAAMNKDTKFQRIFLIFVGLAGPCIALYQIMALFASAGKKVLVTLKNWVIKEI